MEYFHIQDPLIGPGQTLLLEASAGTGKTFTIASLVTRYLADTDIKIADILLITFGRLASLELRDRTYEVLTRALEVLEGQSQPANELENYLINTTPAMRDQRRHRLHQAWIQFDLATISTIHQFCMIVLKSLGTAGTTPHHFVLVEDLTELIHQVVDDAYLIYSSDQELPFDRTQARALVSAHIADPLAVLTPEYSSPQSTVGIRKEFINHCSKVIQQRKKQLHYLDYQDLLIELSEQLPSSNCVAAQRIRQRWPLVLVDEFQDTDIKQWDIINKAFHNYCTLILIGDPKQAIYRFRGGDIYNYLHVTRQLSNRRELGINWRSDKPLVDCLNIIFTNTDLGHPDITVPQISACKNHDSHRLTHAPHNAPFRLRLVSRHISGSHREKKIPIEQLRKHICADLAGDIAQLLASPACWDQRPVCADDIAILVETHKDAHLCAQALTAAGIAVSYTGDQNIFSSQAAQDWLCLLEALLAPYRNGLVKAAAATSFFGYPLEELLCQEDQLIEQITQQLYQWAQKANNYGVVAILDDIYHTGMLTKIAHRDDIGRLLVDLNHIGQLLTQKAYNEQLTLEQVRDWLAQQCANIPATTNIEYQCRIDHDTHAVRIMTIFAAKGLQFPIVYLPFLFRHYTGVPSSQNTFSYHQLGDDQQIHRCLYIGESSPEAYSDEAELLNQAHHCYQKEKALEHLRITYVGLTRAQSQIIAWWAPSSDEPNSGLSRLLRGRTSQHSPIPLVCDDKISDTHVRKLFTYWQDRGGLVLEESSQPPEQPKAIQPPCRDYVLCPQGRHFSRTIDPTWGRTSYSALIHHAQQTPVEDESVSDTPDTAQSYILADEYDHALEVVDNIQTINSIVPLAEMPRGAMFGSLVHAVLETADPSANDLAEELTNHIRYHQLRWPIDLPVEQLAQGLVEVYDTHLGPLARGITLRQIRRTDRMEELTFDIPLGHGNDKQQDLQICVGDLAILLEKHLPADDPLREYHKKLSRPSLGTKSLRGYLGGSLDLVFRLTGPQYFIVDYKTNYLGNMIKDYNFGQLSYAMMDSDYPLQALLYSVVLHRFLRWRQPQYDPDKHFGGVLYLFLRGMRPQPGNPQEEYPPGVFSWKPPVTLITAVSDVLDKGLR